ncbi:hypothetical protein I4U23_017010 [Adineta vaga]|nr:hypothetical protein I4U23_017010 [Adineta vaga]
MNNTEIETENVVVDTWLSKECAKRKVRSIDENNHFSPLLSRTILPACMPLFNMVAKPPYNVISITPMEFTPLKVRVAIRTS